jgi:simple sugar transport system permease protein
MLLAGFITTVLIGYSGLGAVLAKPLVLITGMLVGASAGALVGLLKARFNIHEVVSTIMLNYTILYVVSFFIKSYYIDPVSRQSKAITESARLTLMNVPVGDLSTRIPICFVLALLVAVALYFILMKTKLGFELRAVGSNRRAAQYAGIRSSRIIVIAMTLSGACAGLAGVTYYLGYFSTIEPGALTSVGFDSIAVALLASSNPLGAILSSLLISTLKYGSTYMSSTVGVSEHVASLVIGIVLLFCACNAYIQWHIDKRQNRSSELAEGKGADRPDEAGPDVGMTKSEVAK